MKEIGGYIEFEHYHGEMLHGDAIKLNSGRSCLAYLILAKQIKKIVIPYFLCDCIEDTCQKYNVLIRYYHIGDDFLPVEVDLDGEEWLYLVNYYGQLSREKIKEYKSKYERIILDNAHAYFEDPIPGIDTLYTCRKFFGVPDGGILYTDRRIEVAEIDESYNRMLFLVGRYEKSGSEFFRQSQENEEHFSGESIKRMSKYTENILHSLNYNMICGRRTENYSYLYKKLSHLNILNVRVSEGPFMYPLMIKNGAKLREFLITQGIYVPRLWPNVIKKLSSNNIEHRFATEILPIPCDQRYFVEDMEDICKHIKEGI